MRRCAQPGLVAGLLWGRTGPWGGARGLRMRCHERESGRGTGQGSGGATSCPPAQSHCPRAILGASYDHPGRAPASWRGAGGPRAAGGPPRRRQARSAPPSSPPRRVCGPPRHRRRAAAPPAHLFQQPELAGAPDWDGRAGGGGAAPLRVFSLAARSPLTLPPPPHTPPPTGARRVLRKPGGHLPLAGARGRGSCGAALSGSHAGRP